MREPRDGFAASAFLLRILPVGFRHMGLLIITVVNENAITEKQGFPGLDRCTAVLLWVAGKKADAERICREQPISPRVPVGRMAEASGTVKYRDAEAFAVHGSIVIHPVCARSPNAFFSLRTI